MNLHRLIKEQYTNFLKQVNCYQADFFLIILQINNAFLRGSEA